MVKAGEVGSGGHVVEEGVVLLGERLSDRLELGVQRHVLSRLVSSRWLVGTSRGVWW